MQNTLRISDIYASIQGEGINVGIPVVIVRLSGCSMRCGFCDTKYSWRDQGKRIKVDDIIDKIKTDWPSIKNILITGGEPLEQDISKLTRLLSNNGYYIAIETNGAHEIKNIKYDWLTVSPKMYYNPSALKLASEIKLVITDDISGSFAVARTLRKMVKCIIFLQPESNKKKIINKIIQFVKQEKGYRLGFQLHKLFKIK